MEKLNVFRTKKSFLHQDDYSFLLLEVCSQLLSINPSHFEPAFIWNFSETIRRVSFKQQRQYSHKHLTKHYVGDIYLWVTVLYTFTHLLFPCIFQTNQPPHRKCKSSTRKHAKLLTVWAWQFTKWHSNCISITTNKLRFHCLVPNIWLAGTENGTFDWLDLKMLESNVSVLSSDWFSLSGWPQFQ